MSQKKEAAMMEFHISRATRSRYQVNDVLFSYTGNVVFADLAASRELANRMNEVRDTKNDPEAIVNPAALFAMGLIDEISHALVEYYRKNYDPQVMTRALFWFETKIGREGVDKLLRSFVAEFPNTAVFRGEEKPEEWLAGSTGGMPHREAALEEILLLWLANQNQAFSPFKELFDDQGLGQSTDYPAVTADLGSYFAGRPAISLDEDNPNSPKVSLLDLLQAPLRAAPNSLNGQLAFLRENWPKLLGDDIRRLLLAVDVLKEEETAIWMRFHPHGGDIGQRRQEWHQFEMGSHADVPSFTSSDQEYERFSPDVEWMPRVVLIAKSTYVWLVQLSRQYGRQIERLDQIPDEELDILRDRGLNGLWLIGLWERSRASKTIKHLCGNPDAVASAYSLASYNVSADLGGDAAYVNLRDRAAARGIRLASDMVPNHMGIDSTWVIEHPEWFLSRPDSPYPAYRFDGPDLSNDNRVEIKIEDHYYEQTDAAVVFRRRDNRTGHIDYVYHGNDGTSFPWNDTAQLNYLSAAVREQVIQTILQVARLFPIIRFDAAMTLARRHVQRLWFPLPGSGGAIPSRAEYSMTQAEFDALMPHEFWREVVDRVAAEVPGTLLLAEAFWLMEGYFVRTLGMHRVYNSAFMVMLRDEDNAKYRSVLKNTLEFDPDIMKRYVNFMSNPDERTAIDQFGTGDKYFGVATMMATLPGLPMFGHGQIEGFTEKYGMEYYRPRYEETPNQSLVDRHQREIAPLLRERKLFAESGSFVLYDFWKENGEVDENVYAYSNRRGEQRAIVLFHNHYGETHGTIHHSAAFADKSTGTLRQVPLQDALALPPDDSTFVAYRETVSGLEYMLRAKELRDKGLSVSLHAYQYRVLLHWRELRVDKEHPWDKLCDSLHGKGVWDLDEALVQLKLQPVANALRAVLDPALIRTLAELSELQDVLTEKDAHDLKSSAVHKKRHEFYETICDRACVFFHQAYRFSGAPAKTGSTEQESLDSEKLAISLRSLLRKTMRIPQMEETLVVKKDGAGGSLWSAEARRVFPSRSPLIDSTRLWAPVLGWALLRVLAEWIEAGEDAGHQPLSAAIDARAVSLFDQLRLRSAFGETFASMGIEGEDAWRAAARIRAAFLPASLDPASLDTASLDKESVTNPKAEGWWKDPDVRWLTGLHETSNGWFFNKESHEQMIWWSTLPELVKMEIDPAAEKERLRKLAATIGSLLSAAAKAGYRLNFAAVDPPVPGEPEEGGESHPAEKSSISKAARKSLDPRIATEEREVVILAGSPPASDEN
ncbi:alpha-amylase family glycosyl hydrolase [Acidisarcina polymorpha]|uniref:alpha-amylase family glycosyl hydrolase n=1 Tax=Acidisarcina polymorpha TaxID=2211140 RepID=UPI001EEF2C1F|nr:alpha-amylase family glycosyl hydrolase [Acidisarcina polymorpha]